MIITELQEYFPKVNWVYFTKKENRGYCIGTLDNWEFNYLYRTGYGELTIWYKPRYLVYVGGHFANPPKTSIYQHTNLKQVLQEAKDKLTILRDKVNGVI